MLKNITLIKARYKHISSKLKEVTTWKTTLKATFGSLLIAIFILLLPSLLIYNFFVFDKIRWLLKIFIVLIVIGYSFIQNYFYDKLIKNYHDKLLVLNTKPLVLVDSIIVGLVLSVFTIILLQIL